MKVNINQHIKHQVYIPKYIMESHKIPWFQTTNQRCTIKSSMEI